MRALLVFFSLMFAFAAAAQEEELLFPAERFGQSTLEEPLEDDASQDDGVVAAEGEISLEQAELRVVVSLMRDPRQERRRIAVLWEDWFYCYPPTGEVYRVPAFFVTDFASIPDYADAVFSPFGDHAEAAIIHDWLYAVGEASGAGEGRLHADEIFRYAMMEQGVGRISRNLMYRAVRAGGGDAYGRDTEWRFLDPRTGQEVEPPFARPAQAAVTTMDCDALDASDAELRRNFRSAYGGMLFQ